MGGKEMGGVRNTVKVPSKWGQRLDLECCKIEGKVLLRSQVLWVVHESSAKVLINKRFGNIKNRSQDLVINSLEGMKEKSHIPLISIEHLLYSWLHTWVLWQIHLMCSSEQPCRDKFYKKCWGNHSGPWLGDDRAELEFRCPNSQSHVLFMTLWI